MFGKICFAPFLPIGVSMMSCSGSVGHPSARTDQDRSILLRLCLSADPVRFNQKGSQMINSSSRQSRECKKRLHKCARHGALLLLVEARRETKTSAVTGRKDNANKARANPETGV